MRLIAAAVAACLLSAAAPASAAHLATAKGGQAGFYVSPGQVNSVRASFVAPTVTCATEAGRQQLRFGVVAPQVNSTVTEFAQLNATCNGGVLSYGSVLGAGGNTRGGAVSAGDAVTTSLVVSPSRTIATLRDHTSGHTYRITGAGQTLDQTAFIGNRPTTGESAIPTFSSPVTMSGLFVNGASIGAFTHLRYVQVHGSRVLISTTALSNNAFDLVFVRNT